LIAAKIALPNNRARDAFSSIGIIIAALQQDVKSANASIVRFIS